MPREGHAAFSEALLHPDAPVPSNIVDPAGRLAPKRFAVYRNNVVVSLIEALGATFRGVKALVGDAFFYEMARGFVRCHPPRSPVLAEYGHAFPAYVSNYKPAVALPFLSDVARLDRAWLDAYHAADAEPLSPNAVVGLASSRLEALTLTPHPAFRLTPSAFPLAALWQAVRAGDVSAMPEDPTAEWALVTRPRFVVGVLGLSPVEGDFFRRLANGCALGPAADKAISDDPQFELATALSRLLESGAFVGPPEISIQTGREK